jgi:hypothetical protein
MRRYALLLLLLASPAAAAPTTSGISGTFKTGESGTLTGVGFGSKSPAAPYFWATFDSNANGTSYGQVTSLTLNNMAWDSDEGHTGGGIKATNDTGNWTAGLFGTTWLSTNDKLHISKRERWNFFITDISQNWKNWRAWADSGQPNIYFSASNGRAFVEYVGGSDSGFWSDFNPDTTAWTYQQIFVKASSGNDIKDGELAFRVDGVDKAGGNVKTRGATVNANITQNYVVHCVLANKGLWNPAWQVTWRVWADDIYADKTWQRVDVCDEPVYEDCRKFGRMVPTSWSNTSITGVFYLPGFAPGELAYAHPFDTNGDGPATGREFTVDATQEEEGDPAPTVIAINFSTGSWNGGWTATATCTDLSETVTVTVGTSAATGVVRVSPTSVRFIVPAGTPGSTADLTVTNTSDDQFGTLANAVTYDSLPPPENYQEPDPIAEGGLVFPGLAP